MTYSDDDLSRYLTEMMERNPEEDGAEILAFRREFLEMEGPGDAKEGEGEIWARWGLTRDVITEMEEAFFAGDTERGRECLDYLKKLDFKGTRELQSRFEILWAHREDWESFCEREIFPARFKTSLTRLFLFGQRASSLDRSICASFLSQSQELMRSLKKLSRRIPDLYDLEKEWLEFYQRRQKAMGSEVWPNFIQLLFCLLLYLAIYYFLDFLEKLSFFF